MAAPCVADDTKQTSKNNFLLKLKHTELKKIKQNKLLVD
jgi:hypothetical protein